MRLRRESVERKRQGGEVETRRERQRHRGKTRDSNRERWKRYIIAILSLYPGKPSFTHLPRRKMTDSARWAWSVSDMLFSLPVLGLGMVCFGVLELSYQSLNTVISLTTNPANKTWDFRNISLLRESQRKQWSLPAVGTISRDTLPKVTGDTEEGKVRRFLSGVLENMAKCNSIN